MRAPRNEGNAAAATSGPVNASVPEEIRSAVEEQPSAASLSVEAASPPRLASPPSTPAAGAAVPPPAAPRFAPGARRPAASEHTVKQATEAHITGQIGNLVAGDNGKVITARTFVENNHYGAEESGRFTSLTKFLRDADNYLEKQCKLVAPRGFLDRPECYSQRLLIVIGPESSGRYAAAVYFAAEMIKRGSIKEVLEISDDAAVDDHAIGKDSTSSRLIIIQDAFASGRSLLQRLLRSRGDPGDVSRMLELLRGAQLVVTISEERLGRLLTVESLCAQVHQPYFVRDYLPRSGVEVLRRHLAVLAGESRALEIEEALGDLQKLLDLKAVTPPRIFDLATFLWQEVNAQTTFPRLRTALEDWLVKMADPESEVASFLNEATPDDRIRAVQLAFFENCPESEFWRLSALLRPDSRRRERSTDWMTENLASVRERLRAEVTPVVHVADGVEHAVPHIGFRRKHYARMIRRQAKDAWPDLVRAILRRIADEIETDSGLRKLGPSALGLMAIVDWPRIDSMARQWVSPGRAAEWHELAAPMLASACLVADVQVPASAILEGWCHPDVESPLCEIQMAAAASVYRYLGRRQLERAVSGLHEIAIQLDLTPLAITLPFDAHLQEAATRVTREFIEYIEAESDISSTDDFDEAQIKVDHYLDRVANARGRWGHLRMTFESMQYAFVALGLIEGRLESLVQVLCDWSREEEKKKVHTIRLTASLLTWRLLQALIAQRQDPKAGQDPLAAIIESDEEMLDTFAELLAACLDRQYAVKLHRGSRLPTRLHSTLLDWFKAAHLTPSVQAALIARARQYLANASPAAKYALCLLNNPNKANSYALRHEK